MRIINTLVRMMYLFLILELFLMGCDLAVLANSKAEEYETYLLLTRGSWAPLFLGVELTLGGVIPLILLSYQANQTSSHWAMYCLPFYPLWDSGYAHYHRGGRSERDVALG